jgi:hypothetical protein
MPAWATRKDGRPPRGFRSKVTAPALGGTMPMIERTVVVLPMPLRPRSVTTSPARTANDTPNSTWLAP